MVKGTDAEPPLTIDRRGFVKLAGVAAAVIGAPASAALAQVEQTERVMSQPAPPLAADENTADILVDTLITWGATHVFGIVGDGINPIVEALRKRQDRIAFIGVRHEEAAFMAGGMAKHGGRLGVCLATTGPGAVHLMNGLYDAAYDNAPVVAITGTTFHDLEGMRFMQSVDTVKLMLGPHFDAWNIRRIQGRTPNIATANVLRWIGRNVRCDGTRCCRPWRPP